jgi:hypothetical protein
MDNVQRNNNDIYCGDFCVVRIIHENGSWESLGQALCLAFVERSKMQYVPFPCIISLVACLYRRLNFPDAGPSDFQTLWRMGWWVPKFFTPQTPSLKLHDIRNLIKQYIFRKSYFTRSSLSFRTPIRLQDVAWNAPSKAMETLVTSSQKFEIRTIKIKYSGRKITASFVDRYK